MVIPVAEAVLRVVCPVTVRVEAVVVAKATVPVAYKLPVEKLDAVALAKDD